MKTLSRYLARRVVAATAFVFAALLILFAFFDLIDQLGDLGKGNYRVTDMMIYVVLSLPGHAYEIFPVAVMIGTIFALARVAANSEYTVMRASGVSVSQVALALALTAIMFALLTFVFGEYIAPQAEQWAQELRLKAMSKVVAQEFRSGLWVRDNLSFVNVKQVMPDNTLRGIHIYEMDEENRLRSIRVAREGVYLADNNWRLTDVTLTRFEAERVTVTTVARQEWESVLNPALLAVLLVAPEQMSFTTLEAYIDHLREQKQQTSRYEIALWTKLSYPFAVPIMMLIAVPFASGHARAGGVGTKIFAGIVLGVAFHFLNRLFAHLGTLNGWSAPLTAILPILVFLAAAVAMIWQVEKR
jgi:lipopolysaccharide export system permease protein